MDMEIAALGPVRALFYPKIVFTVRCLPLPSLPVCVCRRMRSSSAHSAPRIQPPSLPLVKGGGLRSALQSRCRPIPPLTNTHTCLRPPAPPTHPLTRTQGISILGVNPRTRRFASHVDKWDSIQNNDYFSLEGAADLFKQARRGKGIIFFIHFRNSSRFRGRRFILAGWPGQSFWD